MSTAPRGSERALLLAGGVLGGIVAAGIWKQARGKGWPAGGDSDGAEDGDEAGAPDEYPAGGIGGGGAPDGNAPPSGLKSTGTFHRPGRYTFEDAAQKGDEDSKRDQNGNLTATPSQNKKPDDSNDGDTGSAAGRSTGTAGADNGNSGGGAVPRIPALRSAAPTEALPEVLQAISPRNMGGLTRGRWRRRTRGRGTEPEARAVHGLRARASVRAESREPAPEESPCGRNANDEDTAAGKPPPSARSGAGAAGSAVPDIPRVIAPSPRTNGANEHGPASNGPSPRANGNGANGPTPRGEGNNSIEAGAPAAPPGEDDEVRADDDNRTILSPGEGTPLRVLAAAQPPNASPLMKARRASMQARIQAGDLATASSQLAQTASGQLREEDAEEGHGADPAEFFSPFGNMNAMMKNLIPASMRLSVHADFHRSKPPVAPSMTSLHTHPKSPVPVNSSSQQLGSARSHDGPGPASSHTPDTASSPQKLDAHTGKPIPAATDKEASYSDVMLGLTSAQGSLSMLTAYLAGCALQAASVVPADEINAAHWTIAYGYTIAIGVTITGCLYVSICCALLEQYGRIGHSLALARDGEEREAFEKDLESWYTEINFRKWRTNIVWLFMLVTTPAFFLSLGFISILNGHTGYLGATSFCIYAFGGGAMVRTVLWVNRPFREKVLGLKEAFNAPCVELKKAAAKQRWASALTKISTANTIANVKKLKGGEGGEGQDQLLSNLRLGRRASHPQTARAGQGRRAPPLR